MLPLILFDDNYKMDSGFRRNDTAQNRVFRETQFAVAVAKLPNF